MSPFSIEHCGQGAADDFAQGELSLRGIAPQLENLRSGQLDGESDFGRAYRKRAVEALGLL
jgi:hypothetical protein